MGDLRYNELKKVALITLILNIFITAVKLAVGIWVGSIAVISDAIHTSSDAFTTMLVMAGLKYSSRAPDKNHPYGHQRMESIVSLFMSLVLVGVALYLAYEGVLSLIQGQDHQASRLAVAVIALSIVAKECMYRYTKHFAKKHNSTSMLSDAWHQRSDAISSVAVLIGLGGNFFGISFLEPIAAIAVCVAILKVAIDIGKEAIRQLIDQSADEDTREIIKKTALSVDGVLSIDQLHTRQSAHLIFVDMEIVVRGSLTVTQGHFIAQSVQILVEESNPSIYRCTVHVHPGGG